ncbi:DUF4129 domain-containing protein [Salinimicrobium sp. HB62]|uniref:DUF4129 domain-containing protein n=1 Tax=Salinimicrobium sp. HB62 TaxID=3077781 RepID=UPI002D771694|nr:DUF4129 domain-containing protein [Salinimicrobium sp. HB62]
MIKFFLFFVLGISLTVSAGELNFPLQTAEEELTPLDFSEETIERFKEDPDYDYSEAKAEDHWWAQFKRYIRLQWQRFLDWMFGDYEAPLLLAIFLDVLPYLLLGLLLAFTLYLFGKINPGNYIFGTPDSGEIHFTEEEKIIKTRDIKKLIEKAVASENYRLAVRYHFLYLLQQLSQNEIVVYDPAKTDEEYVLEIKDPKLQGIFKKISRIYDYVWYGDFAPNATDYQKIKNEFGKSENLIQPQHEQSL